MSSVSKDSDVYQSSGRGFSAQNSRVDCIVMRCTEAQRFEHSSERSHESLTRSNFIPVNASATKEEVQLLFFFVNGAAERQFGLSSVELVHRID